MKITNISANIRFSKALDDGSYKTIQLGAEATVKSQESWREAQSKLYEQLGQNLKRLWASRNGKERLETSKDTVKDQIPLSGQSRASQEHFCVEHGVGFQRYEKNGNVWFSHKTQDGSWCREKRKS